MQSFPLTLQCTIEPDAITMDQGNETALSPLMEVDSWGGGGLPDAARMRAAQGCSRLAQFDMGRKSMGQEDTQALAKSKGDEKTPQQSEKSI